VGGYVSVDDSGRQQDVVVDAQDDATAAGRAGSVERPGAANVARKLEHLDPRVSGGDGPEVLEGPVGRAVHSEGDLILRAQVAEKERGAAAQLVEPLVSRCAHADANRRRCLRADSWGARRRPIHGSPR